MTELAVLTNFVPPYKLEIFRQVQNLFPSSTIVIDALTEPNRSWAVDHDGIRVTRTRSVLIKTSYKHSAGFSEESYLHIPVGLPFILFRLRPKVIVTSELGLRTLAAVTYKLLFRSTKVVVWVEGSSHADECRGFARRILRKFILAHADAALCISEAARKLVTELAGSIRTVVHALPNACESSVNCRDRTDVERKRLLFVGQIVSRKGILGFIRSLANVCKAKPDESVELWICGSGPQEAALRSMPIPQNLSLNFVGEKSYSEMSAIYNQCGVLVFPTLSDVWGLVVSEAMAAGLPVLGSNYSEAVADLVEDGVTGWRYCPTEEGAAERALDAALSCGAGRIEQMGLAAQTRVAGITPSGFACALRTASEL